MTLDRRRNAFRPDLADARLRGRVDAARFVEGRPARVVAPLAPVRRHPSFEASLETEALCGEPVLVFDETEEGWAWVQLVRDAYVGWLPAEALGPEMGEPDLEIVVPRTLVFPGPDIKLPPVDALPLGARIMGQGTAEDHNARYHRVKPFGAVVAQHCRAVGEISADFVAVAESLMGAPYLWGGKSMLGIDCSGLVQLAAFMAGMSLPRDTDMQAAEAGVALSPDADLRRGDLVFWKGHVGIMRDAETLLHANAHHMMVASEPLAAAVSRGASRGSPVTCLRRLFA